MSYPMRIERWSDDAGQPASRIEYGAICHDVRRAMREQEQQRERERAARWGEPPEPRPAK